MLENVQTQGVAQIEPGADAVLLVVHVYREGNYGEEIIRIIF